MTNIKNSCPYVAVHDLTNGCVELFGVVEVDSDDVWPADVLLCVGMLRGHLREAETGSVHRVKSKYMCWVLV